MTVSARRWPARWVTECIVSPNILRIKPCLSGGRSLIAGAERTKNGSPTAFVLYVIVARIYLSRCFRKQASAKKVDFSALLVVTTMLVKY